MYRWKVESNSWYYDVVLRKMLDDLEGFKYLNYHGLASAHVFACVEVGNYPIEMYYRDKKYIDYVLIQIMVSVYPWVHSNRSAVSKHYRQTYSLSL